MSFIDMLLDVEGVYSSSFLLYGLSVDGCTPLVSHLLKPTSRKSCITSAEVAAPYTTMSSHSSSKTSVAAFVAAVFFLLSSFVRADVTIYDDALASGWQNWSWATVDMASTAAAHTGTKSVAVTAGAWTALSMVFVNTPINTASYGKLSFWANGGASGGQILRISALLSGSAQPAIAVGPLTANTWTHYELDLANLGAANSSAFNGVWFQEGTGVAQPVFYIDDVSLETATQTSPPPLQVDGLGLFDDGFVNGWQNWSWASVSTNTAVTNSGAASLAVTSGPTQALYFHHSAFSSQGYSDFIFYINGGPVGGQSLKVQALLSDAAQPAVMLQPLVANTWTKVVIPLANLGAANKPDLTGIWIQETAGMTQPVYYVDDAYLLAAPPPSTINVSVDAGTTVQTVDPRIFGLNTAIWDSVLNTATTAELLNAIDVQALRFPGGSASDVYHWQTNMSDGQTFTWASNFDAFANVAVTTGSQVYVTVNYGTGTPEEAAAWVQYSNVTKNYGFKYWEVGNENYGTWEADKNNRPWDPVTYANRFKLYMEQMKAIDPTIKVCAVIEATEDGSAHYPDESVINPRTGVAHKGFSAVLLATFKDLGIVPDVVVYHRYEQGPGGENDAYLLNASRAWKADAQKLRQMLNDYLGAAGAQVEIDCTENNSVYGNPGKQTTSLVNGLFLADSIGNILQTEFKALVWWDLRNGQETGNNNTASLYGWRNYGNYGIMNGRDPAGPADVYPTYYVYKLLTHFARGGESVVSAASDYNTLGVYAARTSDSLRVLLINKSPKYALNASLSLNSFDPATQAQVFSYGIPQDEAAHTGMGSADVASDVLTIPGKTFTYSTAPYSATVITIGLDPATSLAIQRSGYSLNRRTNRVVQTVTLTNTGSSAVMGPVYLALGDLSANTTLSNASGMTSHVAPMGSPYVVASNTSIAPGAFVTVVLEFTPPSSGSVTYTPRAVVVTGAP